MAEGWIQSVLERGECDWAAGSAGEAQSNQQEQGNIHSILIITSRDE